MSDRRRKHATRTGPAVQSGCRSLMLAALAFGGGIAGAITDAPTTQPGNRETAERLLSIVGEDFAIRDTEHFVIAYDGPYEIVRPHVGRIEGAYNAALRFAAACGLAPQSPPRALPMLFFDQFADFAAYADKMGMDARKVAGFYHVDGNISAFVNTANAPSLRAINEEIDRAEQTLIALIRQPDQRARTRIDALRRNLSAWRAQRHRIVERYNRLVLLHEATHQVLFNVGVHAPSAKNPQWLVEGLACQFEVPQTQPQGKLVGINQVRLGDLRDALGVPAGQRPARGPARNYSIERLVPLADLIGRDEVFSTEADDGAIVYAQSWALVSYLHRQHPAALANYLRAISQRRTGDTFDAERELSDFGNAFGAPDERFLAELLTWILALRFDPQEAGR